MAIKEELRQYKKELILKKCGEYLEERGYEKTKMADLAQFCNISVGSLYKLFPSKDELFYEYVNLQIDRFYDRLQELFQTTEDPIKRLELFLELKFETFMSKKALLKDTIAGDPLFFAKLSANKENPAAKIYELLASLFEELDQKESLKIKDYYRLAHLFNAMSYGYIEYWIIEGKIEPKVYAKEALEIFMKGLL